MKNKKNQERYFLVDNPLEKDGHRKLNLAESVEESDGGNYQTKVLWGIICLVLVSLFLRTSYLQLVRGGYYQTLADNNRVRTNIIKAPRGLIKDHYGDILAQNYPSFEVVYSPAFLPEDKADRKDLLNKIKEITSVSAESEQEFLEANRNEQKARSLSNKISSPEALQIMEQESKLPGIYVAQSAKREYRVSSIFAHIIGYEGKVNANDLEDNPDYLLIDDIGKSGVEKTYEKELKGAHGEEKFEVDAQGKFKQIIEKKPAVRGNELILNIDGQLQQKMHEVLQKILDENKAATGAVGVAIDPRSGAVRALVSLPTYDNNLFSGGISQEDYQKLIEDKRKPLLNRVIAGEYPPGSTFKLYLAAAALQEGVVREDSSIDCGGLIQVGNWKFPDWKAHGITDVKKAIAESCDVFFYAVGGGYGNVPGLGINKMKHYAEMFGYGRPTEIDLPGEHTGNIPDENWKFKESGVKWYVGDNYHASIGQGFISATPLQVTVATAAIANDGKVYVPRLAEKIIDAVSGEEKIIEPKSLGEILINKEAFWVTKEGMRQAVTSKKGTGRLLNNLKVSSAGKTGTAQFNNNENLHAWYTSFAPYENPELAMTILIEGGGEGYDYAVPATKDIYQWYFDWERGDKKPDIKDEKDY